MRASRLAIALTHVAAATMLRPMFGSVLVRDMFCDVVFVRRRDAGPRGWRDVMGPDQAMALVRQLSHQERCAVEAFAARVDGSSVARVGEWLDGAGGHIEALLWSGEVLALRMPPPEPAGARGGGGGEAHASNEQPLPDVITKPSQSDDETGELSYYELQLFDERDCPIAGVEVKLQTPLGTTFAVTDADGCARVNDAPAGFGHASVVAASLREALRGDEQRPRRTTPLPEEPPWHVRTMRQLSQSVMLPDAERQKLMVITRTVVTHDAELHEWDDLHLLQEGPFHLLASQGMRLALHADGRSTSASVRGAKPKYPDRPEPTVPPPPIDTSTFIPPNIYVVHYGDTLVLIAKRFLGDGARWTDIWALNKASYPGRSPDVLYPGDQLVLPADGVPEWLSLPSVSPYQDPSPPPPSEPAHWLDVNVDDLHDSLLSGLYDAAYAMLSQLPTEAEDIQLDVPPPYAEELAYRQAMLELALEGKWSLPRAFPPSDPPEPLTEEAEKS